MKLFILIAFIAYCLAINMPCSTAQQCPANSYCQANNMCACNTGYIGDCTIPANLLNSTSISLILDSNKTTFFYTNP